MALADGDYRKGDGVGNGDGQGDERGNFEGGDGEDLAVQEDDGYLA